MERSNGARCILFFGTEVSGFWGRSREKLIVMKVEYVWFGVCPGLWYPISRAVVLKLGSSTEGKDPIGCLRNTEYEEQR